MGLRTVGSWCELPAGLQDGQLGPVCKAWMRPLVVMMELGHRERKVVEVAGYHNTVVAQQ